MVTVLLQAVLGVGVLGVGQTVMESPPPAPQTSSADPADELQEGPPSRRAPRGATSSTARVARRRVLDPTGQPPYGALAVPDEPEDDDEDHAGREDPIDADVAGFWPGPARDGRPPAPELSIPLTLGGQLAVALLTPLFGLPLNVLLMGCFGPLWPLLGYPLVVGYGITTCGNSAREHQQDAFWPMAAALVANGGVVVGLGVALVGLLVVSSLGAGPAVVALTTVLGAGLAAGLVAGPMAPGVAAVAAWAVDEAVGLPAVVSFGAPRMERSDDLNRAPDDRRSPPPPPRSIAQAY